MPCACRIVYPLTAWKKVAGKHNACPVTESRKGEGPHLRCPRSPWRGTSTITSCSWTSQRPNVSSLCSVQSLAPRDYSKIRHDPKFDTEILNHFFFLAKNWLSRCRIVGRTFNIWLYVIMSLRTKLRIKNHSTNCCQWTLL